MMFTARQFELIGRVTIAFNDIEAIIGSYGPTFVHGPLSAGEALAKSAKADLDKQLTFDRKVTCLKSRLKALPKNDKDVSTRIDAVLESLTQAKALSLRRNEIVHSEMVFDVNNRRFVLRNKELPIDTDEETLDHLVVELCEFVDTFRLTCHELYGAMSLERGYSFPN